MHAQLREQDPVSPEERQEIEDLIERARNSPNDRNSDAFREKIKERAALRKAKAKAEPEAKSKAKAKGKAKARGAPAAPASGGGNAQQRAASNSQAPQGRA